MYFLIRFFQMQWLPLIPSNLLKMKKIFLLLAVVLFVLSCETKTKSLRFEEEIITTPVNEIVHVTIPVARDDGETSKKINRKIRELISQSLIIGDPDKELLPLETQIDSFNIEYQNFKNEFPETPMIWEAQIDGEVLYQSDEIITIALTIYTNTGGAHGVSTITFANFDTISGESLNTLDIFNNVSAVHDISKQYFYEEIKGKEADYFNPNDFELPANIGFSEDGIVFLYNVYEIAPYSSGITEFTIPFFIFFFFLNYH